MKNINELLKETKGIKIPLKFENPIDTFLIKINQLLNPIWYSLNFTPNTLTTISLILAILSIYCLYKKKYTIGAFLYFVAYYFDCADGNYARTYKMQSKFGDYYDHISDIIKIILLFYYIYNTNDISKKNKIRFLIIFGLIGLMNGLQVGCQQKIYKEKEAVLNFFTRFCINTNMIKFTRYFGVGTLQLFLFLFILLIPYLK